MELNIEVAKKRFTEMFEVGKDTRDLALSIDGDDFTREELMHVSYNGPLDNDWNRDFQKIVNKFKWCSHSCKYNNKNGRIEMILKRSK
jgi:hypothetical protein